MILSELKQIIKADKEKKKDKYYARRYYNYKPNRYFPDTGLTYEESYADRNGKIVTVERDRKTFMYTNYAKLLINQKVDYILGQLPTMEDIKNYDNIEVADLLEDMTLTAALDVRAWVFLYYYKNEIKHVLIPDKQIIDKYDEYNNLIEVLRYYDQKDEKDKLITYVEIWTLNGVEKYSYREDGEDFLTCEVLNHYNKEQYYNKELVSKESYNFDFIPFICMINNKNMENDIESVKDLLDFYNIIKSGYVDNILKFQEALMKLRGFGGGDEFLKHTNEQMKKYKLLALGDPDSDAEYMSVEIPVEARKVILESLNQNIFKIGQGMDVDQIGDGNITNIVIKNRYSALNMKADKTIKQLKKFYKMFAACLNSVYKTNVSDEIVFNKSINWNESEIIDNCVKSTGIISNKTIIKNHPWTENVEDELRMIEDDTLKNTQMYQQSENNFNKE